MNDFDLDIKDVVDNLKIVMGVKTPEASYSNLRVTYWDDGDYRAELSWGWGEIGHVAAYRKSSNSYYYYNIERRECENLGREDLDIDIIKKKLEDRKGDIE